MKMKRLGLVAAVSLMALGSASAMADHAASRIEGRMVVQIIGEVKAVDPAAHRVTVVDSQGAETALNVGADVHDLDKLPLGTRVKSGVLQPVTLTPAGHTRLQEALPGDKRFVAQVTSVDTVKGVIMLKDADNLPIEVRASDARKAGTLASGTIVRVEVVSNRAKKALQKTQ